MADSERESSHTSTSTSVSKVILTLTSTNATASKNSADIRPLNGGEKLSFVVTFRSRDTSSAEDFEGFIRITDEVTVTGTVNIQCTFVHSSSFTELQTIAFHNSQSSPKDDIEIVPTTESKETGRSVEQYFPHNQSSSSTQQEELAANAEPILDAQSSRCSSNEEVDDVIKIHLLPHIHSISDPNLIIDIQQSIFLPNTRLHLYVDQESTPIHPSCWSWELNADRVPIDSAIPVWLILSETHPTSTDFVDFPFPETTATVGILPIGLHGTVNLDRLVAYPQTDLNRESFDGSIRCFTILDHHGQYADPCTGKMPEAKKQWPHYKISLVEPFDGNASQDCIKTMPLPKMGKAYTFQGMQMIDTQEADMSNTCTATPKQVALIETISSDNTSQDHAHATIVPTPDSDRSMVDTELLPHSAASGARERYDTSTYASCETRMLDTDLSQVVQYDFYISTSSRDYDKDLNRTRCRLPPGWAINDRFNAILRYRKIFKRLAILHKRCLQILDNYVSDCDICGWPAYHPHPVSYCNLLHLLGSTLIEPELLDMCSKITCAYTKYEHEYLPIDDARRRQTGNWDLDIDQSSQFFTFLRGSMIAT